MTSGEPHERSFIERHSFSLAFAIAMMIAVAIPFLLTRWLEYPVSQLAGSVAGALVGGRSLDIRGRGEWLALLVLPIVAWWTLATVAILAYFMVFIPDGFVP